MDEKLKQLLQEYVATANNPDYNSDWGLINSKFPEFKDYDPELLEAYVATANNPQYESNWDTINSKFPEFVSPKKSNEVSGQGLQNSSTTSTEPLVASQSTNPELDAYISDVNNWTNLPDGFRVLNVTPEAEAKFGDLGTIANSIQSKDWAVRGSDGLISLMDINSNRDITELEASLEREELTPWQSVKNSIKNIGTQLKGFDDRLTLTTTSGYEALFGLPLAIKVYDFLETRKDSKGYLGNRQEALNNLQRLGNEMLPTLGIIESGGKGDLSGVGAGIVNGASSVLSTLITGALTFGGGIASDMLGGAVYDYNEELAKTKGVTTQELFNSGQAELGVPLTIGAISTSLELFGIGGIRRAILPKLTGDVAKKMAVMGLEMNKEGLTEWTQFGLDAYANAKARGLSDSESVEALATALISEQGIESYLQGLAGSASAVAGGRLAKGVINKSTRDKVSANEQEIISIGRDLSIITDPKVKSTLIERASELADETNTLKNQEASILESLTPEQQSRANEISNEMDSISTTLAQAQNVEGSSDLLSESTIKALEQRQVELGNELDTILQQTTENGNQEIQSGEQGIQVEEGSVTQTTQAENTQVQPNEVEVDDISTTVDIDTATDSVQQKPVFTETEQAEIVNIVSNVQGVQDSQTFVESIRTSLSDSNIRQSRIAELEAKFANRQPSNLGIAQDPQQEAQYWADVTEYAILKIADGTIKTVQALGKALGVDAQDANVQKAFQDAQAVNNIIKQSTVTPKKQTVKSTIKQATDGRIKGTVELTNREALTNRIRILNEGARLGKRDIVEQRKEIGNLVKELNESKAFKGKVNATALRRVANSVNNANTPKQIERATKVIERIVDDAKFANKIANVDNYRRKIARVAKSKNTPKDLARVLNDFSKISTRDLEIEQLDEYLTLAESIYNRESEVSRVNNSQLQRLIDIASANKEEAQLEREERKSTPEAKQVKLVALRDKLIEELGIDSKVVDSIDNGSKPIDEVITELQELIDSMKETRESAVRKLVTSYLGEIQSNQQEILANQTNPAERTIIQEFLDLGAKESEISKSSLGGAVTSLYNLLNNSSAVGLGKVITEIKRNRALADKGTVSIVQSLLRTPTKLFQWLVGKGATSGSQTFDAIIKNKSDIGKLHTFTGFIDVQIQSNKAFGRIEKLKKDFSALVKKHSKDLNNNPVGEVLMTIYADVIQYRQGWTAEQIQQEYDLRIGAWGESLERRLAKAEKDSNYKEANKEVIANLSKALNQVAGTITDDDGKKRYVSLISPEQFYDKLTDGHKAVYKFMTETFGELRDGHFAVSRAYAGLDVETDWINYTPRTYTSIPSTSEQAINRQLASASGKIDDVDTGLTFNQSLTKENTGSGKSRLISGDKLPLNKVLNTQMLETFLNEASAIIYDTETMAQRQYTSSMLDFERNGLEFEDQVPMILYKEKVAQKILGDKFSIGVRDLSNETIRRIWSKTGKLGTTIALGGAGQFLKQVTPLVEVMGRIGNPKRIITAMSNLQKPEVVELMKLGDIAVRSIENEYTSPKGSNLVNRQDQNEIIRILKNAGMKIDEATEKAMDLSLAPLKLSDDLYARIGWLTFYTDFVANKNNGVIDYSKVDKEALAYANTQNSIVMNESDSALQAGLTKKNWMRLMFPFSSFSINAKMTLINSTGRLSRALRNGDAKGAKRFAGELAGNLANIALFNAIGYGLRTLAIMGGAYFVSGAIMMSDLPEDEKKEMLEELAKLEDDAKALNQIRSLGYLTQDFIFGGLFGKFLEPATESVTDGLIRWMYGDDELRARGWSNAKAMMSEKWYDGLFALAGTQGIYGKKVFETITMGADMAESPEDYITRRFGEVNAMRDDVVVDSYYLDENNIDKYAQPEWERASTMTSLLLSGLSLTGISDQTFNSNTRYATNMVRNLVKKDRGTLTKQSKEQLIESAKKITSFKVGDVNIQLDYDQKMWYYSEWTNTVAETTKSFKRPEGMSETDYEKLLVEISEAQMQVKFLNKYNDLFETSIRKDMKKLEKDTKELIEKLKYYGKK